MPSSLLDEDERAERDRLDYPEVLRIGYFLETFGWDYDQYRRCPEWLANDLMSRAVAKNEVESELSDRLKDTHDEGESAVTKNMSLGKVREMYGYGGRDDIPDEALADLIGRR